MEQPAPAPASDPVAREIKRQVEQLTNEAEELKKAIVSHQARLQVIDVQLGALQVAATK